MWNHRLVRQEDGSVRICEVFYDNQDRPYAYGSAEAFWTIDDFSGPVDSIDEQLCRMMTATEKPILSKDDMIGDAPGF
jgi:hypothetical protein